MYYYGSISFVPYTSRNADLDNIEDMQRDYCEKGITAEIKRKERQNARRNNGRSPRRNAS